MKYNLSDEHIKRIAAIAHHTKGGNMIKNISSVIHNINTPEQLDAIGQAHTLDAYQQRFKSKDDENIFKSHIAKTAAINRGHIDLVPSPQNTNPTETGSAQV